MAFLGPDTHPLGEREMAAPVTESQIAATIAALLGEDYGQAVPRASAPIADVLGSNREPGQAERKLNTSEIAIETHEIRSVASRAY
jgi:hypothetical protein